VCKNLGCQCYIFWAILVTFFGKKCDLNLHGD
jgi:hypothetical protein